MNWLQAASHTATLAVMVAIATGAVEFIKQNSPLHLDSAAASVLLLAVFLITFKIKTGFDDHQHFGDPYAYKSAHRYIGFIVAVFSWLFWIIAGYFIFDPQLAAFFMFVAIAVSTVWIAVHGIEIWRDPAVERRTQDAGVAVLRMKWIILNIVYIVLLVSYSRDFEIRVLQRDDTVVSVHDWWILVVLLTVLLYDMFMSSSFTAAFGDEEEAA